MVLLNIFYYSQLTGSHSNQEMRDSQLNLNEFSRR